MKIKRFNEQLEYLQLNDTIIEHLIDIIDNNFIVYVKPASVSIHKDIKKNAVHFKWQDVSNTIITFIHAFKEELSINTLMIYFNDKNDTIVTMKTNEVELFNPQKDIFLIEINISR